MSNSFTLCSTLIKMLKNTEKCWLWAYTFMLPCVCPVFCFVCRLWQCDRTTFVKLYCQCCAGGQGWEPRNIFLIVCVYMDQCPAAQGTHHTRQPHLCHTSVTHLVSRVTSCHWYVTLSSHSSIKTLPEMYKLQTWLQGKPIIQSPEWSIPSHQNKHGLIKNDKNNPLALEQDITMVPSARLLLPRSKISQDNCIYPINWCSVLYLLMLQNSSQYGYNSQLILFFTKALEV